MNSPGLLATAISYRMIKELRDEAAVAGDLEMVSICNWAMRGDKASLRIVTRVIADAQARADD